MGLKARDNTAAELRRAAGIIEALMSRADCAGLVEGVAFLSAVVPVEVLDDAFAFMGEVEDLEPGGDDEPSLGSLNGTARSRTSQLAWSSPARVHPSPSAKVVELFGAPA